MMSQVARGARPIDNEKQASLGEWVLGRVGKLGPWAGSWMDAVDAGQGLGSTERRMLLRILVEICMVRSCS